MILLTDVRRHGQGSTKDLITSYAYASLKIHPAVAVNISRWMVLKIIGKISKQILKKKKS